MPQALFAVAWLGVVGSGFAYLFFFRLLAVWAPTRVSLVTYLMQVVAVGLGVIVLGEALTIEFLAGAILVDRRHRDGQRPLAPLARGAGAPGGPPDARRRRRSTASPR